uniref:Uncharacterized protein n=1 Tax=Amphimedon queenslandica TaxID=400682 RepID=A0A1X7V7S1_AMPQE
MLLTHWHIVAEISASGHQDMLLSELLTHWHIVAEISASDHQDVILSELLTRWLIIAEISASGHQDVILSDLLTRWHIVAEISVSGRKDVILSELLTRWHIVTPILVLHHLGEILFEMGIHSLWISSFLQIPSSVSTCLLDPMNSDDKPSNQPRRGRRLPLRPPRPLIPQPKLNDRDEERHRYEEGTAERGLGAAGKGAGSGDRGDGGLLIIVDLRAEVGEEGESGAGQDIELELLEGGSPLSLRDSTLSLITKQEEGEREEEVGEEGEEGEGEEQDLEEGGKDSLRN